MSYKIISLPEHSVIRKWVFTIMGERDKVVKLLSKNPADPPIEFQEGQELTVFGVVEHVINPAK